MAKNKSSGPVEKTEGSPVSASTKISIPKLETSILTLTIAGDSPLVVHKFAEKAKRQMLDKQMGVAKNRKDKKDPEADFLGALYTIGAPAKLVRRKSGVFASGRFGFPAGGVKKAMVGAARQLDGLKMTFLRGAFHVLGDSESNLVEILGEPKMREDAVRLATGVADLRYRPGFMPWSMKLLVEYNTSVITPAQVAHLVNMAGFAVGLGENRPDRGGEWGRFHVASTKETLIGRS